MNKFLCLSLMLFVLIFSTLSFGQEPFGQKIDCSKYKISEPILKETLLNLQKMKVPDKKMVGVPPYPGAKILNIRSASKRSYNCISLLTGDDCEKILSYYRENLKDWFNIKQDGCYLFWQGKRWDALLGKSPNVTIRPVDDTCKKCFPEMKSEIVIWYASND